MTARSHSKCPDCIECQHCAKVRCLQCRGKGLSGEACSLGPFITRGEYLKWQERKNIKRGELPLKRKPAIDHRCCTDCESCIELCPTVFFRNPDTYLVDVSELPSYPVKDVEKAISICPGDCIHWEQ